MVPVAVVLEDQVEKYGAYVGIAAFFGLAVLALLYFAQARELKRLREWAGRSPERAQELEERVVAQAAMAEAGRRTGSMTLPPRTAPPRRADGLGITGQATQLAQAVGAGPPRTGPGGTVSASAVPLLGPGGTRPAGPPAAARNGTGPEPAVPEAAPAGAEGNGSGPPTQAIPPPSPPAIPRATPQQRPPAPRAASPPPAARPAAVAARRPTPGATPKGRAGGVRSGAGRSPARGSRSAGTVALLVGLAVLVLGGGAFAASQLLGGDEETPAPTNQATAPANQPPASDGGTPGAPTPEAGETTVAVLNGTTQPGLAKRLADRLAGAGYEQPSAETNTRDQAVAASTVFYGDGFRGQASRVARRLEITAVEPMDAETRAVAPSADVVVLVGADQAS